MIDSWWWSAGPSVGVRPQRAKEQGGRRTVSAGEERLAAQHLREHAPDAPDVDRAGVFLEREHHLWRAVPSAGAAADARHMTFAGWRARALAGTREGRAG